MKRLFGTLLGAGLAVIGTAQLSAHHSSIQYTRATEVEVSGTIKEFQYTNPHSWLFVDVVDKTGQTVAWGFEAEGPSTLLRNGIKISSLKPGEKITVKGYPLSDGRPAALLISVAKADGSVLSSNASLRRGPGGTPIEAPVTQ